MKNILWFLLCEVFAVAVLAGLFCVVWLPMFIVPTIVGNLIGYLISSATAVALCVIIDDSYLTGGYN